MTTWRDAVINALRRYRQRHGTSRIERGAFLREELASMVVATSTQGRTPEQTVSRDLQHLRDQGFLMFSASGVYVLTDHAIDAAEEDFEDDILEQAITNDLLALPDVEVSDELRQRRVRKGVEKLHQLTLVN